MASTWTGTDAADTFAANSSTDAWLLSGLGGDDMLLGSSLADTISGGV